ncbi:MAG: SDR family NAD(P)-dependent oxidoreductase [Candidatus Aenigmarchaeota archaeon]|nr:SDR family NAD(P)-dependent oxidoreductase [Candidatus Aenigmarchaeota archaeon]
MKVLVTGGSGFIGTHLVNKLVENGNEVIVMDNAQPKLEESKDSPKTFLSLQKPLVSARNPKAKFIAGDIRSEEDVRIAMQGCKAVFHLAAIAQARNVDEDLMYKVNYLGSKTIFDAAEKRGAKIVFTSTAAVYGNAPPPLKETANCKPISYYGTTKLKAEQLLKGTDAFVTRLFNVYGPFNNTGVINVFCRKMMNYEEMPLIGTGRQTRDFVYVDDVVDALLLGMEHTGIYNVGTGKETSVLQLIETIEKTTRYKPNIKRMPPSSFDPERSIADITKISRLGWKPNVSLEKGIRLVLESLGEKFEHI